MGKRVEREVIIKNVLGLHVRPATALSSIAALYKASFSVVKDDVCVDGKSSINLLTLAATQGTALKLISEGDDAEELIGKTSELIENGFGEE